MNTQYTTTLSWSQQLTALLVAFFLCVSPITTDALELDVTVDGWHRWSVDAVENAPSYCCYSWDKKDVKSAACNLDDKIMSYGSSKRDRRVSAQEMQFYAKVEKGRVKKIQAFGDTCAVDTKSAVFNHGKIDVADSLAFLSENLNKKSRLAKDSLAAIAVHDSNEAQAILEATTKTSESLGNRKAAIFWMGQVRAKQSEKTLIRLLNRDDVDEVREHVVFSISQSALGNRLDLIERVARKDRSQKVRGQGWFWISQSDDGTAERRIMAGIKEEASQKVQEQAVFALSQLDGEAGTTALINVVETKSLGRPVRKQALFWLAQSESSRAADYLANVLER